MSGACLESRELTGRGCGFHSLQGMKWSWTEEILSLHGHWKKEPMLVGNVMSLGNYFATKQ